MEDEPKFITVSKKLIDVFASKKLPFPECINAIVATLDFMFSARNDSKEEISRMIEDMKTGLLELREMTDGDSQTESTQDEKKETIRKVLSAAKLEKTGLDTVVYYSSKFIKELYHNNVEKHDVFSILATMMATSFSIFKIEKEDSEIVLSDIFNKIRNKI